VKGDRGSASIWLLAVGLVVVAVGLGAVEVGVALTNRHRAQVAADLGALAGARYAVDGASVACARAGEVVIANGATLVACELDGFDLTVGAQVGPARATARAGPLLGQHAPPGTARSRPPRPGRRPFHLDRRAGTRRTNGSNWSVDETASPRSAPGGRPRLRGRAGRPADQPGVRGPAYAGQPGRAAVPPRREGRLTGAAGWSRRPHVALAGGSAQHPDRVSALDRACNG
jgi:secretion/DNA translocation related TadE-like protein